MSDIVFITRNSGSVSGGETIRAPVNTAAMSNYPHRVDSSFNAGGREEVGSPGHAGRGNVENAECGRRFDGDEFINPDRSNPWINNGSVYSDPQAFGSVIGSVPALADYGDISQMYTTNLPPMHRQPVIPRQQSSPASVQQVRQLQHTSPVPEHLPYHQQQQRLQQYQQQQQQQQQHHHHQQQRLQQHQHQQHYLQQHQQPPQLPQQQISSQMRSFLEDRHDYQYYRRSCGGRSD